MADLIRLRRDSAADWTAANPVLADGEAGLDTTNRIVKIGDGVTAWSSLQPWVQPAGTDPIYGTGSDGDVVISSNTTLTRDMNYRNLTVNVGVVLSTGGYLVRASGLLTLNGTISNAGGETGSFRMS